MSILQDVSQYQKKQVAMTACDGCRLYLNCCIRKSCSTEGEVQPLIDKSSSAERTFDQKPSLHDTLFCGGWVMAKHQSIKLYLQLHGPTKRAPLHSFIHSAHTVPMFKSALQSRALSLIIFKHDMIWLCIKQCTLWTCIWPIARSLSQRFNVCWDGQRFTL